MRRFRDEAPSSRHYGAQWRLHALLNVVALVGRDPRTLAAEKTRQYLQRAEYELEVLQRAVVDLHAPGATERALAQHALNSTTTFAVFNVSPT